MFIYGPQEIGDDQSTSDPEPTHSGPKSAPNSLTKAAILQQLSFSGLFFILFRFFLRSSSLVTFPPFLFLSFLKFRRILARDVMQLDGLE